jgi:hypothetical protein
LSLSDHLLQAYPELPLRGILVRGGEELTDRDTEEISFIQQQETLPHGLSLYRGDRDQLTATYYKDNDTGRQALQAVKTALAGDEDLSREMEFSCSTPQDVSVKDEKGEGRFLHSSKQDKNVDEDKTGEGMFDGNKEPETWSRMMVTGQERCEETALFTSHNDEQMLSKCEDFVLAEVRATNICFF